MYTGNAGKEGKRYFVDNSFQKVVECVDRILVFTYSFLCDTQFLREGTMQIAWGGPRRKTVDAFKWNPWEEKKVEHCVEA